MRSLDFPWRVAVDRGASFELLAAGGSVVRAGFAGLSGERPAVGDYVTFDSIAQRILAIAPRTSFIARARESGEAQLVAANVTTGFVVTSPEAREFSPRRIVRYLLALRAGGVEPVIVLNKCDEIGAPGDAVAALREAADGAPVVPASARDGTNCDALLAYLHPDATVALCGSSGVGKSTLLNRLCGRDLMEISAMRDDGRGRHTTTFRQLIVLPNGAAIVDTPGMRAFMPFAAAGQIDEGFSDIAALATRCRFGDCAHDGEPGCAVAAEAAPQRLEQWQKLQRELAWVESRTDAVAAKRRKEAWKRIHKAVRRKYAQER